MRTTAVIAATLSAALACGVGDPKAEPGPACQTTPAQAGFLGRWNLTGTVTKNTATWPVSFGVDVVHAADCAKLRTTNGECAFEWALETVDAGPSLVARNSACEPKAKTRFTFNGMNVYDGARDPFPNVGLTVTLLNATFTLRDGGADVSGQGTLGSTTGSEAMRFEYTGSRP